MTLGSTRIVLSLSPQRLAGARVRGTRVVQAEQVNLEPGAWSEAWSHALTDFDQPLRQLLSRMGARGVTDVSVLYHSPGSVVQIHDIAGSRSDAQRAAAAKTAESLGPAFVTASTVLAPSSRKPGAWSVLSAADRDEHANAVFAWASRNGARLVSATLTQATVAHYAVSVAQRDPANAHCVLGTDWSAIAYASDDQIHLVRAFELGYRPLVDVYQRTINAGAPTPPNTTAEQLLFAIGLPFKSRDVDPALRTACLPLLSPVVQRLSVEIKQTLRFGLVHHHAPTAIMLHGPGAAVPHLAAALTEGLDMHVQPAPGSDPAAALNPFSPTSVENRSLDAGAAEPSLLAHAATEERTRRSYARALTAGVALAAVAVGGEYALTRARTDALDPQFARISADITRADRQRETREDARELALNVGHALASIDRAFGERTDWAEALVAIASAVTGTARLETLAVQGDPGGAVINIAGLIVPTDDADTSTQLGALLDAIRSAPSVDGAELGASVRDQASDGRDVRRFTMTVRLRPCSDALSGLVAFANAHDAEADR